MMHTEEQARKTRCCGGHGCGQWVYLEKARDIPDDGYIRMCITSGCMAWQFVDTEYHREVELWSKSKNKRVNSSWGDDVDWRPVGSDAGKEPPKAVGFCGLTGKEK